jgi:CHAT domain-containing protein/Tfp pilus assembly protein PilF
MPIDMKKKFLSLTIFLKFGIWFFLFSFSSFAQPLSAPTKLSLNNPLSSQIKGGEKHLYSLALSADQTARVEVIQKGVELELAAFDPAGEKYIETNSPTGLYGEDLILVTAQKDGKYLVEVRPFLPGAGTGEYTIELKKTRPTVQQDLLINGTAKLITQIAYDAARLRFQGTSEATRESLLKWADIAELSRIKKDRAWAGVAFGTRGVIYQSIGELQNALNSYLKSYEIWKQLGNREYEGSMLNNLGMIYLDLSDHGKSISYLEQALTIRRKYGDQRGVATIYKNLGHCYKDLGEYETAKKYYRQSISIFEKNNGNQAKRDLADALHNLGLTYLFNNETKEGQPLVEKALRLRREVNDVWGINSSLLIIGKALWDSGYKEAGEKHLREAKQRALLLGDRVLHAESLYYLAIAEREKGKFENIEKAIEYAGTAYDLIEKMRGKIIDSQSRYGYFSSFQKYHELYIDLFITRSEFPGFREDISIALQISESSRARSLLDLLEEANVDIKTGIDPQLLAGLNNTQNELNNQYALRGQTLAGNATSAEVQKVSNKINDLNTEIQRLKIEIARQNPKYARLKKGRVLSGQEIQSLLDEQSILLEYKLGDRRSFVWLVTKDGIGFFKLPSRQIIEAKAKRFYELVTANKKEEEAERDQSSIELGGILFSQFADKLAGRRLIIVADGSLQYVPFSALRSPEPGARSPKSGGPSLIERNEIVMLPSASVLAQIRKNKIVPENNRLAVFADPVFDAEDARIKSNIKTVRKPIENILITQALRDFQFGETLPRLLASRQEAREIFNLAGAGGGNLRMGFDANLKTLETKDLSQYKILHFATHGLINTKRPELSGLVFSLYDKNGLEQNGFLSLNDIYNLDLKSDLVVLSACQTAFGKDIRGEGLIGLSRGFLYAGSNRVIASFWKVDDFATAEFMKRFYRNHLEKKMSAPQALRQAKLEMKKIRRYQSPYYWSGFSLFGDWK